MMAVVMAALVLPGCGAAPGERTGPRAGIPGRVEVLESRVDVIHGQTLVLPVVVAGGGPPRTVRARLDDGRVIDAKVHQITIDFDDRPSWLPPAGNWAVAGPADAGASGRGLWVLTLDLPHDALNQNVTIGGSEVELNWFLDPSLMRLPERAWALPHPEALESPQLMALAEEERRSPVRRWRYRLLTDGLAPGEGSEHAGAFADEALEALAQQAEARWTTALGMLWRADAALAGRVRERLAAVVAFPDGTLAPAWPLEQSTVNALLTDLLNPAASPAQRASRASAWLEALPGGAAWVIDDGGLREAGSGAPIATAGVANLGYRDAVFSASPARDAAMAEMRPIPSLSARTLAATMPAASDSSRAADELVFAGGRWSANRRVVSDVLPVSPPGLRMGPLAGDWTLNGWLQGAPDSAMRVESPWSTAALLYYRAPDGGGGRSAGGSWQVHVECRAAAGDSDDEFAIWIGPFGSPTAVLTVRRDGEARDVLGARNGRSEVIRGATVTALPDRWVASVPIDPHLIDTSGELRIGIVRTDGRGVRSTWPRPMLPWQTEPGRITVDTTSWGEIVAPAPVVR